MIPCSRTAHSVFKSGARPSIKPLRRLKNSAASASSGLNLELCSAHSTFDTTLLSPICFDSPSSVPRSPSTFRVLKDSKIAREMKCSLEILEPQAPTPAMKHDLCPFPAAFGTSTRSSSDHVRSFRRWHLRAFLPLPQGHGLQAKRSSRSSVVLKAHPSVSSPQQPSLSSCPRRSVQQRRSSDFRKATVWPEPNPPFLLAAFGVSRSARCSYGMGARLLSRRCPPREAHVTRYPTPFLFSSAPSTPSALSAWFNRRIAFRVEWIEGISRGSISSSGGT